MKKKVISLMLAACMVMGMTACGSSAEAPADTQSANTEAAAGTETQAAATDSAATTTESTGDKELAVQVGPDPETIDPA